MSDGYGPPPPTTTQQRRVGGYILWGLITLAALILGMGIAGMAMTPEVKVSECEYVLTPSRDDAFLRCPVPEGYKIPDWPDKQAPLNK